MATARSLGTGTLRDSQVASTATSGNADGIFNSGTATGTVAGSSAGVGSAGETVDLIVYESTLPVSLELAGIAHVSGRQAGERAAAAGIGRLVITHVPPEHDPDERMRAAEAAFGAPVELAIPGRTFVA